MRAINAVAMVGGFTYRAKQKDLLITRASGEGKQERAGQETHVFPGDVMEVPERFFGFLRQDDDGRTSGSG